jgi:hypothetical protein
MNRTVFINAVKLLLLTIVATPSAALAITAVVQQSSLLGLLAFFAGVPALFLGITLFEDRAPVQTDADETGDAFAYARMEAGFAPRTPLESALYADRQMNEALDRMSQRHDF